MTTPSDRQIASRVAARTQIRDVRLWRSNVQLVSVPLGDDDLSYTFDVLESSVDWEAGDDSFVVRIQYSLEMTQQRLAPDSSGETDEEEVRRIATLDFTMAALFTVKMRDDDADATQEEILAYARSTGAFAIYPFVREYVYDVTGRLRLPSLTLGVTTIPVEPGEGV